MSYIGRFFNDPNVRHSNHQLSFLKRLPTRKQSLDTDDSDLESEREQSAEQSIETKPDKKQNSGLYEKVLFGLSFLEGHHLDGFEIYWNLLKILKKLQLI